MKQALMLLFALAGSFAIAAQNEPCLPANYSYLGGGLGFSQNNAVVNAHAGLNSKVFGLEASVIAHTDNRNPALLNVQFIKSFYGYDTRLSFLGGMSYQVTTADKVGGTQTRGIVGLEFAKLLRRRGEYTNGLLYFRGQVSEEYFIFMVGLQGMFSKN